MAYQKVHKKIAKYCLNLAALTETLAGKTTN